MNTAGSTLREFKDVLTLDPSTVEERHGRGFLLQWIPDGEDADEPDGLEDDTFVGEPTHADTMPRLNAIDETNFRVYPLRTNNRGNRCIVGRDDSCDIVIDDRSISRRHAELEFDEEGRLRVFDHGSTNGTLVARRPVFDGDSATIEFGKSVQFGQIKMTFMPVRQFADFIRLVSGEF
ncbi:MAG: FHA domain-containing protein [Deltaproteobacteria bacterium]|nr:FHA domain-containing protein [Deltaproteobacteria bacterium]